jgi:hypothetical protein
MPSHLPPCPFPPLPHVRRLELSCGIGSISAARMNRNRSALLGSMGLEAMAEVEGGRMDWVEAGWAGRMPKKVRIRVEPHA